MKKNTKYVRLWGTRGINTLKFNPSMPYHDPKTPYVNYWFSFSEAHTGRVFNRLLSDENINKLVQERGACIAYTHFASGFTIKSKEGTYLINPTTKYQITKLAYEKDGWFVTTSELLDRLLLMKNITLHRTSSAFIVSNLNKSLVNGVTILVEPSSVLYDYEGRPLYANKEGEIILGDLLGLNSMVLYKNNKSLFCKDAMPTWFESVRFVLGRILVWVTTRLDY